MNSNYLDIKSPAHAIAKDRASDFGLKHHGLTNLHMAYWNLVEPALYEEAMFRREGSISHLGPLVVNTGKHTARAANDKFVVQEATTDGQDLVGTIQPAVQPRKIQRGLCAAAGLPARPRPVCAGLLCRRRPELPDADSRDHGIRLAFVVRSEHVHPYRCARPIEAARAGVYDHFGAVISGCAVD